MENAEADSATLLYLRAVYQCRELLGAVRNSCTASALNALPIVFSGALQPSAQRAALSARQDVHVTDSQAQLASVILGDLCAPDCPYPAEPTGFGRDAVEWMQQAVFGKGAAHGIMQLVYSTTILQAHQARDILLTTALLSVSASNCLRMYSLASQTGMVQLQLAAMAAALPDLEAVADSDPVGLQLLSNEELQCLLSSEELQVESESSVLLLLLRWAAHDAVNRNQLVADLACACVRFEQLSMLELELLDQHKLVVASPEATRLVATLYVCKIVRVDLPGTAPVSRRCRARQQQPKEAEQQLHVDEEHDYEQGQQQQEQRFVYDKEQQAGMPWTEQQAPDISQACACQDMLPSASTSAAVPCRGCMQREHGSGTPALSSKRSASHDLEVEYLHERVKVVHSPASNASTSEQQDLGLASDLDGLQADFSWEELACMAG